MPHACEPTSPEGLHAQLVRQGPDELGRGWEAWLLGRTWRAPPIRIGRATPRPAWQTPRRLRARTLPHVREEHDPVRVGQMSWVERRVAEPRGDAERGVRLRRRRRTRRTAGAPTPARRPPTGADRPATRTGEGGRRTPAAGRHVARVARPTGRPRAGDAHRSRGTGRLPPRPRIRSPVRRARLEKSVRWTTAPLGVMSRNRPPFTAGRPRDRRPSPTRSRRAGTCGVEPHVRQCQASASASSPKNTKGSLDTP